MVVGVQGVIFFKELVDSSFHFSKRSSAGLFVSGSHAPRKLSLDLSRLWGAIVRPS